jgi:RimJ/RimL family protein N-acetyltransferase
MKVSIRPLSEKDAIVSFRWRNNADVWRYTGNRPDRWVTEEMETQWIKAVLSREGEKRYAICVGDDEEYVGNVQLTDITTENAQFHIFIGKVEYHGKGIGTKATQLVLDHARSVLKLRSVYLKVDIKNTPALRIYEKCGFRVVEREGDELTMKVYFL